jgi:TolB-like protein
VFFAVCFVGVFLFSFPVYAARWYEYYLDAQAAVKEQDWEAAIELFKKAIEKDSKPEKGKRAYGMRRIDYYPYLEMGKVYLAKGDIENAHFYCEQAKKEGAAPKNEIEKCLNIPLKNVPTPPPSEPEKMKVAVLDFTSSDETYKELAMAVADTLQTKLIGLQGYTIIVRGESLKKVMEELAFQQTGVVDEQTAVEVGKQLGAKFVITGSVAKPGTFYNINAIMIDVETGTAINAASIDAKKKDEILKKVPELALKLTSSTVGTE